MKRKSPRGIPDFSSKGPKSKMPQIAKQEKPAPQAFTTPKAKPQATSSKAGGRRGG
jgi:hypothetical protein